MMSFSVLREFRELFQLTPLCRFTFLGRGRLCKAGITPGVIRWLPDKNTLRLIHKIEPVSILAAYFCLATGVKTLGVIPP